MKNKRIKTSRKRQKQGRIHPVARRRQSPTRTYPLVSICVLTYDGLEFTKQSFQSLLENTVYPNWELIVVDNGSKDGTVQWLRKFKDSHPNRHIRLIFNKKNVGIGKGRNQAIATAHGTIFCTADNDMLYEKKGWLSRAVKILQTFPQAAAVGLYAQHIRVLRQLKKDGLRVSIRKTVPPGNAVFTRSAWKKIGPFREDVLFKEGKFSGSIFSYEINPVLRAYKLFPIYGGRYVGHLRQKVNIRRPSLRRLRSKKSLMALEKKKKEREKQRRKRRKRLKGS